MTAKPAPRRIPPKPQSPPVRQSGLLVLGLGLAGLAAALMPGSQDAPLSPREDSVLIAAWVPAALLLPLGCGLLFARPDRNKLIRAYDRHLMRRTAHRILTVYLAGCMAAMALLLTGLVQFAARLMPAFAAWREEQIVFLLVSGGAAAMAGGFAMASRWQKPVTKPAVAWARSLSFSWRAAAG